MKRVLACGLCLLVFGCSMPSFPTVSAWMSGDVDDEATAGDRADQSSVVSSGVPAPPTGIETQNFSLAAGSDPVEPEAPASESVEARHLTRSDVEDGHRGVFRPRDFAEAPGTWLDMAEIPLTRSRTSKSEPSETSQLVQARQFSDSVNTPPSGVAGRVQVAEMPDWEEARPTLALAPPSAPAPAPAPAPSASHDDSAERPDAAVKGNLPEVNMAQPWTREAVRAPSDPVRPRLVREGETLPDLPSAPLPGIQTESKRDLAPEAPEAQPVDRVDDSAGDTGSVGRSSLEVRAPAPAPAAPLEATLRPASFTAPSDDEATRALSSSPAPEALRALLDTRGTEWNAEASSSVASPAPIDRTPKLKAGTYLVVGSFRSAENAERLARKHNDLEAMVLSVSVNGQPFHRVAVPVADGKVEQTQERVLAAGFSSVWPLQR